MHSNPSDNENGPVVSDYDLVKHVEQALQDYHQATKLTRNPIVRYLDLDPFRQPGDNSMIADGLALRRALDQGIDAISGRDTETNPPPSQWRLQDYLHLRYREDVSHKDIAQRMGYSCRHLLRLRKELLLELTEVLLNAEYD